MRQWGAGGQRDIAGLLKEFRRKAHFLWQVEHSASPTKGSRHLGDRYSELWMKNLEYESNGLELEVVSGLVDMIEKGGSKWGKNATKLLTDTDLPQGFPHYIKASCHSDLGFAAYNAQPLPPEC